MVETPHPYLHEDSNYDHHYQSLWYFKLNIVYWNIDSHWLYKTWIGYIWFLQFIHSRHPLQDVKSEILALCHKGVWEIARRYETTCCKLAARREGKKAWIRNLWWHWIIQFFTPFRSMKDGTSTVSRRRVTAQIRHEIPPEDGHSFFGLDGHSRLSENSRSAFFHVIQLNGEKKIPRTCKMMKKTKQRKTVDSSVGLCILSCLQKGLRKSWR